MHNRVIAFIVAVPWWTVNNKTRKMQVCFAYLAKMFAMGNNPLRMDMGMCILLCVDYIVKRVTMKPKE